MSQAVLRDCNIMHVSKLQKFSVSATATDSASFISLQQTKNYIQHTDRQTDRQTRRVTDRHGQSDRERERGGGEGGTVFKRRV